jgi:hypothetical protein
VRALVLALLIGGAPAPAPKPECESDSDCVLATRCSCECCKDFEPMTQAAHRAERQRCARLGPCGDPKCDPNSCPRPRNPAAWTPVCSAGRCAAERKAAASPDAGR